MNAAISGGFLTFPTLLGMADLCKQLAVLLDWVREIR